MTKDILVSIRGLQISSGQEENEPVEVITAGDYYKKNNKHYVMDITKRGVTNVHMVFEKNKKNITCYETPFGNMMLGINASDIQITEEEDAISVDVKYALELNYEHLADCSIRMAIQSREGGKFHI